MTKKTKTRRPQAATNNNNRPAAAPPLPPCPAAAAPRAQTRQEGGAAAPTIETESQISTDTAAMCAPATATSTNPAAAPAAASQSAAAEPEGDIAAASLMKAIMKAAEQLPPAGQQAVRPKEPHHQRQPDVSAAPIAPPEDVSISTPSEIKSQSLPNSIHSSPTRPSAAPVGSGAHVHRPKRSIRFLNWLKDNKKDAATMTPHQETVKADLANAQSSTVRISNISKWEAERAMKSRNRVVASANSLARVFKTQKDKIASFITNASVDKNSYQMGLQARQLVDSAAETAKTKDAEMWKTQRLMFEIAMASMRAIDENVSMTSDSVKMTDHVFDVVARAYEKFAEIIEEEFLMRIIPNKIEFDKTLSCYDRDTQIMSDSMHHLSTLQDEMRVSQATMEIAMARKQRNIIPPYSLSYLQRCTWIAEQCGAAVMTITTEAGLRCEVAAQKLLDSRKANGNSPFDRIVAETAPIWPCVKRMEVDRADAMAAELSLPYSKDSILNKFEQLATLNNKLKLVIKLQAAAAEVDKREKEEMQEQINELATMFIDYSAMNEELMLCDNLLLVAEHDLRLDHQKKLKEGRRKLIELPEIIKKKMEDEVGGPVFTTDYKKLMPLIEITSYRNTTNNVIDILNYENDSESEEEFRYRHGLIPRVRRKTKKEREAEFIERQKRKAGANAPPPPTGPVSPTSSQKTTPTNSRAQSPSSSGANLNRDEGANPATPSGNAGSNQAVEEKKEAQKPKKKPKKHVRWNQQTKPSDAKAPPMNQTNEFISFRNGSRRSMRKTGNLFTQRLLVAIYITNLLRLIPKI